MRKVKVGIVGACGFMGQTTHIHAFTSLVNDCEVVAVVGSREKLLNTVADRFGIRKRYRSVEELCNDGDIEAAVVTLPPEWNLPIASKLLSSGKHVMCEKPLALSVESASNIVKVAKEHKRLLMVAYMKRYDPGVQMALELARQWEASGEMGSLLYARAHCFIGGKWTAGRELLAPVLRTDEPYGAMPERDPGPKWLSDELRKNLYGHGNLYYHFLHVHCHNINLMRAFLGDDCSIVGVNLRHRVRLVMFEFSKVPTILEVGGPIKHHGFDEHLTLYFEKGFMQIETPPPLLAQVPAKVTVHYGERSETVQVHADWDWSFRRQALHFIECIRDGKQPLTSGEDATRDIEVVEDIFKAHAASVNE
ncbi:MAG: Gfo/Idh/MocA family oxidoreductase [Armatimonadota bacterium]|nr:Gfo/Idh/MocA family oxidoreductase [Armatimonadota bacterium]MCX7777912.1 Gfo/Idh/MocA family oxidoreductase [Armatimonadota bacterium]MDW8026118.1 Gfo/Idh/MocA family oxidoreductase [Armatimonadota bacterium]